MALYLKDIVLQKRKRLQEKKLSISVLSKQIEPMPQSPSFFTALEKEGLSIIGEIKKASPSKGLIKENFHPLELATAYETSVDAISILTEEDFFLGSDDYLKDVSAHVSLPTLCKDFIIDPIQIYNAKALGASCILLIVNILTDEALKDYLHLTDTLGMDALIECHTEDEIYRGLEAGAKIIGINNRNLKTFKTTIQTTLDLAKYVPKTCLLVSESGILSSKDVEALSRVSLNGILVGEAFMRSDNIKAYAQTLKAAYRPVK